MADYKNLWRRTCINDAQLNAIIKGRAYPQHVSAVDGPKYPCVSLHAINREPDNSAKGIKDGDYQMDAWAPIEDDADEIQDCLERLFHEEVITGEGVRVNFCRSRSRHDGLYQREDNVFHKVSMWIVKWSET